MKNGNKILIAIIIALLGVIIFLGINLIKKENKPTKIDKKEYYNNLQKDMFTYYKIMYKNMNVRDEDSYKLIRVYLKTLEDEGFPMDDFVSYDGKEKCDSLLSFAQRRIENNKYVIDVYYKCGDDSNYDFTKNNMYTKKQQKQEEVNE